MPSLRDRSFDKHAWQRLAIVVLVLACIGGGIYLSTVVHRDWVTRPKLMKDRHKEATGTPGMVTTQITQLGSAAVPVLLGDIDKTHTISERTKSLEMLSAIDDPRVLPALIAALSDSNLAVRMAAMAGLARSANPGGFEPLWKLNNDDSDLVRQRAYVALGLVAAPEHVDRLIAAGDNLSGADKLLLYWAAGQAQRREAASKKGELARPVSAPLPKDEAEADRLAADITEIKRKVAVGEGDKRDVAKELARLTSVSYTTWNFAHQIALQTIAVHGPNSIRTLGRIDRDPKAPAHLQPLELKKGTER